MNWPLVKDIAQTIFGGANTTILLILAWRIKDLGARVYRIEGVFFKRGPHMADRKEVPVHEVIA